MVDRISRIYSGGSTPIQPPEKPKKSEKSGSSEDVRSTRDEPIAARLIPNLVDKVEISEAGRTAAGKVNAPKEEKIPEEVTRSIGQSWYTSGYVQSRTEFDAESSQAASQA